jgi:hypothetical protein
MVTPSELAARHVGETEAASSAYRQRGSPSAGEKISPNG